MVSTITPSWLRTSSSFDTPRTSSVSPNSSANTSGAATPVHNEKHKSKSAKQLWKDIKNAVVEHHRDVNAAYQCYYGGGAGSSVPGRKASA